LSFISSNNLINLNDNRVKNLIILLELSSQNNIISDKTLNKSKLTVANRIEKTRALKKGYIDINTSQIVQLQNIVRALYRRNKCILRTLWCKTF